MSLKRIIVVIAIITLIGTGVCMPAPVRADTTSAFIYAGIGIAAYVAAVFTVTKLVYGENDQGIPTVDIGNSLPADDDESTVHFASRCSHRDGQVTLVCW